MKDLVDVDLEWGVVQACCEHAEVAGHVLTRCRPEDLTDHGARAALVAVEAIRLRGEVADKALVARDLRGAGKAAAAIELFETSHALPIPQAAPGHALHLRSLSLLRRVRSVGADIHDLGELDDPAEAIERSLEALRNAGHELPSAERTVAELVDETLGGLDEDARRGMLRTELPKLDRLLNGGLAPGRLYIIGARPSVGKSALVTNWTRHALDRGRTVLFVSLEMTGREVLTRLVQDVMPLRGVPGDGTYTRDLIEGMHRPEVQGWPLRFLGHARIGEVITSARRLMGDGLGLVVVDYLQLFDATPELMGENRATQVAAFSRALKLMAVELAVPVVAAAQLNRQPAQRPNQTPRLHDLRESGAIEQDADVVVLLHRDVDAGDMEAKLIVAKNRHGLTGSIPLVFAGQRMRFRERERPGQGEAA